MPNKSIGIAEARRLLPRIVDAVARQGGRVDITCRGEPRVSIVRTRDLDEQASADDGLAVSSSLRVELDLPPERLMERIRELRSRTGKARSMPSPSPARRSRKRGSGGD